MPFSEKWNMNRLGKDVAMRPPSGDEEVPVPKQVKENKRKDASVLHHEAFLRIREENEAEVRYLTEKSDSYKLLSEKLRADLAAARDEHEEMAEQIERVKELQSRLDLATSDKASLANELEVVRSEVTEANKRADAKVAQFRIDVEVNQAKAKSMVEHAKWKARREALEEVSAQSFDVEAEIKNAKAEENRARRLAFPEEDSDSSSESEGREDPEDVASDEDQAI
ncbi:protein CROWDED NUCLEI 1-like [Nicotiana tomentosiformis]|uniref:protein CROWDED NUCLEI 1-like n=1 Tax=Nicotiana tomentosiformis TaxID=4098 RepID=UPI00388CCFD7